MPILRVLRRVSLCPRNVSYAASLALARRAGGGNQTLNSISSFAPCPLAGVKMILLS